MLSEERRAERLRQLAKRLRRADGLDRDALKCIEALTEIREDVHRIAAAHGASNVRLLGSAGRGKQDASGNLGLLVDMAEGRTLFDLIALSNELEESLGVEVDVVIEASLSPTCATAFSLGRLRSVGTGFKPMDITSLAVLDYLRARDLRIRKPAEDVLSRMLPEPAAGNV